MGLFNDILSFAKKATNEIATDGSLGADAVLLQENNACLVKPGDLVRLGFNEFGMVVEPKTYEHSGLLVGLNIKEVEWYYCLVYCPYSKTISEDGGCDLNVGADNRVDGSINCAQIKMKRQELANEEHDPFSCPPPMHYFPALDFVNSTGSGYYVPAFDELYDLFNDLLLRNCLYSLLVKAGLSVPKDKMMSFWSSTERNEKGQRSEYAMALDVYPDNSKMAHSLRKSTKAFVLPFKRF